MPEPVGNPVTAASCALFRILAAQESGNLVVSPVTTYVALALVAAGCTEGSPTHTELCAWLKQSMIGSEADVLGYLGEIIDNIKAEKDPRIRVSLAVSLWADSAVKSEFASKSAASLGSEVFALGSKDKINEWVALKTRNMIQQVLFADPTGPYVIVTAMFFDGTWHTEFSEKLMTTGLFKRKDAEPVSVSYMTKTEYIQVREFEHGIMLMLPYGANGTAGDATVTGACIVLPDLPGAAGMQAAVDAITESDSAFDELVGQFEREYVRITLPCFKVEYGVVSLKKTLMDMGVVKAFLPGAEFERLSDSESYVSDFVVKSVIEVDRKGTKAASVAAASGTRGSSGPVLPRPLCVVVDRPFLFVVCDMSSERRKNVVHFMAKIEDVGAA